MVRKQIKNIPEPEIFTLDCPTQQVLDIVCSKWSVIVIYCLAFGTKRYNQLQGKIEGISQKMLTQTLRNLERNGLVERQVFPVVPPRVEYSLSALGETLVEPLCFLADWTDTHIEAVKSARDRYDTDNQTDG
ncbi:MAG: helix-turn-helix domain-containing protein [Cyanobacteriota bacterium]|nr:helix-turn-helix domain-containing protein [Cyanobacteriota bacterium]